MNRTETYGPTSKIVLPGGREIYLTEDEMMVVSQVYRVLNLRKYIEESHPAWEKEKVQAVAILAYARLQKDENGGEEDNAILLAAKLYDEREVNCHGTV